MSQFVLDVKVVRRPDDTGFAVAVICDGWQSIPPDKWFDAFVCAVASLIGLAGDMAAEPSEVEQIKKDIVFLALERCAERTKLKLIEKPGK